VDDPVQPLNIPKPRYPPVLQQAGVSGFVDAQYVVDTLGHAEPVSWKVLRSSNAQFEAPAREAIMKGVFKPARIKGAAVRQLVQQSIKFNIGQ
jgi:periplasmic protein TonB